MVDDLGPGGVHRLRQQGGERAQHKKQAETGAKQG
jgi:hypothetical protein